MPKKSVHQDAHAVLAQLLRELRQSSGMTQAELALALGRTQSQISDIESGGRRLDLVQLRDYCAALNTPLMTLVRRFELKLN